jgi:chromosome segregation ATPase
MTESKDRLIALAAKELAATVSTHGPIDVDHTTSAAKRVVGGVLSHVKHVRASTATRLIDLRQQNLRLVEQRDQLRADLERVTAEWDLQRAEVQKASMVITDLIAERQTCEEQMRTLDKVLRNNQLRREEVEMRHGDLLRANRALEAERDAMREVCKAALQWFEVDPTEDESQARVTDDALSDAVSAYKTRFDATSKAVADAAEDGK